MLTTIKPAFITEIMSEGSIILVWQEKKILIIL
jgi:hypothetical protein